VVKKGMWRLWSGWEGKTLVRVEVVVGLEREYTDGGGKRSLKELGRWSSAATGGKEVAA
jgi:hypothetical protein